MSVLLARVESAIFSPYPAISWAARGTLLVAAALAAALLVAAAGPILALAAIAAVLGGLLILRDLRWGFLALFAVVGLLPFAALPFKIGFTPTFLDLALLALYFVWIMRVATQQASELRASALGPAILVFLLLAIFAFANGLQVGRPTSTTIRNFAELALGIVSFFLLFNFLRSQPDLDFVARLIILAGAAGAAIAVVLYVIPTTWTIRIYDALARFNYPGGAGALRYIEDDSANPMRAIGTQIDPNVLGGFLILMAGFTAPQLMSARPLLTRPWVALCLLLEVAALYLTYSRGSMAGLAIALLILGALRYRKLLLLVLLGGAALLLVPQVEAYVAHFVEGIQLQDRATLMRLGEYKDALALIGRYPWFGVGFSGSPDAGLYVGVSNLYLLMAEEMGVAGVGCYLFIVALFFANVWQAWRRSRAAKNDRLETLLLGAGTGIVAVMAGGMLDHYLFNLVYPHMSMLFWMFLGFGMAAAGSLPSTVVVSRAAPVVY